MKYVSLAILGFWIGVLLGSCSAKADSPTSKQAYKSLIVHAASQANFDPALALAVAEVESSFNPNAVGLHGEKGLFQLHPKFHSDFSIQAGIKTLQHWERHCPTKADKTFVLCHNRGYRRAKQPKLAPYYRKVMNAYQKYKRPPVSSVAAN